MLVATAELLLLDVELLFTLEDVLIAEETLFDEIEDDVACEDGLLVMELELIELAVSN